jgi:hypothetical protein
VRETTKTLDIEISGVHRLRANFAQKNIKNFSPREWMTMEHEGECLNCWGTQELM